MKRRLFLILTVGVSFAPAAVAGPSKEGQIPYSTHMQKSVESVACSWAQQDKRLKSDVSASQPTSTTKPIVAGAAN